MFLINPYILQASGGSYILDTYGSAKVAYSLHQLSSTATLSCRVRRSSDNAEQDIGFVSGDLDTTSLLSFVGANDGYVVKMYDQSGNSNDALQTVAVNQRQIVSSGALVTYGVNGKASTLKTTGSSKLLLTTPFAESSQQFQVAVFDHIGTTESLGLSAPTAPYPLLITTSELVYYNDGTVKSFGTTTTGEKIAVSYRNSSNNLGVYFNNVQFGSELAGGTPSATNYTQIWDRVGSSTEYASTTILWQSDLSANINDINTEINNYYGIY